MEVNADSVIDNLGNQIKEMSKIIAVKDSQIELLQKEIAKLSIKE